MKTRNKSKWRRIVAHEWAPGALCLLLDVAIWIVVYGTFSYLRRDAFYTTPLQFFVVEIIQLLVLFTALFIIGGYDRHTETRSLAYTTEHVLALSAAVAVSSLLIYSAAAFDQTMKPSRGVLLMSFLLFTPLSLAYRRVLRRFVAASTATRAFLVIGSGEVARRFFEAYTNSENRQRLEFVDVEQDRVGQPVAGPGTPIVEGNLASKIERLSHNYSGVIIAERVDRINPRLLDELVRTQFHSTRVYTLESFYEAHWRYVPTEALDPFWPLQMGFQLARISPYHYLKRLFDLLLSSIVLLVTAPLIGLVTLLIWLQDGRPALFRQERVGRDNETFTIFKFRTMAHRPADGEDDIYTRVGDPRITRVGRWLRKLRLDELPQLWNVLRGDMSLIGPRAEWTKCADRYEKKIPFYHFRHLVKPGITGWAQVNYPYGESDEDAIEKLKYDLYYIRHYSLKLDVMIVFKTGYTMLFGRGR